MIYHLFTQLLNWNSIIHWDQIIMITLVSFGQLTFKIDDAGLLVIFDVVLIFILIALASTINIISNKAFINNGRL
jgi:hypothetical protein